MKILILIPFALLFAGCTGVSVAPAGAQGGAHAALELFPSERYEPAKFRSLSRGVFGSPFVAEPRPRVLVVPVYPPALFERGVEGWADVDFTIDREGRVIDVKTTEFHPDELFGASAAAGLLKSRFFVPSAMKDGDRFESSYRCTFRIAHGNL